jgi:hypothetical protein
MQQRPVLWVMAAVLAAAAACDTGRRSAAGFRLPPDGDIERGKAAFVKLGCNQCHDVAGMNLAKPQSATQKVIVLGGEVTREPADGKLVRSIIWPAQRAGAAISMPHYAERMTVRDLTDIVALLQSRYTVRRLTNTGMYY